MDLPYCCCPQPTSGRFSQSLPCPPTGRLTVLMWGYFSSNHYPLKVPIHTEPGPVDPETLTLSCFLGLERVLFVSSPSRLSANTPFEPSAKLPAGRKSPERIILSSVSHPEAGHLEPHPQMVWPGGEHRHNRLNRTNPNLVARYSLLY